MSLWKDRAFTPCLTQPTAASLKALIDSLVRRKELSSTGFLDTALEGLLCFHTAAHVLPR